MSEAPASVLLMVVDALRADCTGPDLMPRLHAVAQESVRFAQAVSQGVSTAPSMASMLTSTFPLDYGSHWYLHRSRKTVAEVLQSAGYSTAAVHSNPYASRLRNFHRGFDWFDESFLPVRLSCLVPHLPGWVLRSGNRLSRMLKLKPYVGAGELNRRLLAWLAGIDQPFFIWLQYMDAHGPYLPHHGFPPYAKLRAEVLYRKAAVTDPRGITRREAAELRDGYEAEVRYVDAHLGCLVDQLKRRHLWDETLVIITSDHGDEFGEHGLFGHGNKPYEELIRVPLVIKPPSSFSFVAGTVVHTPVCLLDVVPTILDLNGVDPGQSARDLMEGESLVPLLKGDLSHDRRRGYALTEKQVRNSDELRIAFRTAEWKFIFDGVTGGRELYQLGDDPGEDHDVLSRFPIVADRFGLLLAERLTQIATRSENVRIPRIETDAEVEDRLRALGYLE
jgi:arylsulfatase A-like enzyme